MKVLVTGGTGYIGSHTCVELLNSDHDVIILDNLSNSKIEALKGIRKITGKNIKFYEADYLNKEALDRVFDENKIDAVINFAAYKDITESVHKPLEYYVNNVNGALNTLDAMKSHNIKTFIFSSSAAVYSFTNTMPLTEESEIGNVSNPYSTSKLIIEKVLNDLYKADKSWNIAILRYFNPIGAHESGLIGENPNGIPSSLMANIDKVSVGELDELKVFGDDYNTPDGTAVRDYIHVVDLAKGHVLVLDKLLREQTGIYVYNLGTGTGYSVLDLVKAYEQANNVKIPFKIVPRRLNDIGLCYTNVSKAEEELGFTANKTIEDMCHNSHEFVKMKIKTLKK